MQVKADQLKSALLRTAALGRGSQKARCGQRRANHAKRLFPEGGRGASAELFVDEAVESGFAVGRDSHLGSAT